MRPSYRYALAVTVALLAAAAAWSMWPASPEVPLAPLPMAPPIARPAPVRPVPPDDRLRELPEALDRLQDGEAAAIGPERAAARRRQRERMILERGGALPE